MRHVCGPPLVLGLLLITAGCTGISDSTPSTVTPTATDTPTHSISATEAKQQALNAEKECVKQILENMTNYTHTSVGIYGDTNATVLNWAESGATVHVKIRTPMNTTVTGDTATLTVRIQTLFITLLLMGLLSSELRRE